MKQATIIIPHHNRHDLLHRLLDCIDNSLFDIIIVSGGSFGENCNKGAKMAETDYLIFANDDIIVTNDELLKIRNFLICCDIVGSTQITKDGKKYYGLGFAYEQGVLVDGKHQQLHYPIVAVRPNMTIIPSGFLFGIRKSSWEKVGGFDTRFRTGHEDVDFGIRCIDQKLLVTVLDMEIYHGESESEGRLKHMTENINLLHSMYNQDKFKELYESINFII
jgi:GT2 family glycosyltransferase